MSQENYTSRERVLHKLTGAAYQMTFEDEHDMAVETMAMAINFWGPVDGDDGSDDLKQIKAAVGDIQSRVASMENGDEPEPKTEPDDNTTPRNQGRDVPGRGTKSRKAVAAMLFAHDDGNEWLRAKDLNEYADEDVHQLAAAVRDQYDFVQWKKNVDGPAHLYRVDPERREWVVEQLRADGNGVEMTA